ncbi:aminotransferase class IV [uncultured Methylobacterium sp.]|uniref:aminotransferase class IV n=1 Tax=uncultured Methylobacterium sp. TaxID=157278 RepID=UPI0035CAEC35
MLWHDGRLVEGTTVPFDLADRGLTLGDGVFDTALALGGRVAFEAAHVDRLTAAAAALGFPVAPDRIRAAMRALAATGERLAIRTTLTRGAGPRGLAPPADPAPTLFATAAPSAPGTAFAPLRLWPAQVRRNETSPTARLKSLGYLDAVVSAASARAAGFDEALFRNTGGAVACAGTGNVFAVFGATILTPPLTDGVLAGIVRAEILTAVAPGCGLICEERSLTPADLERADTVFLTNSLRLLAPVSAIGARAYPREHPIVARLAAALRARVATACGVPEDRVA